MSFNVQLLAQLVEALTKSGGENGVVLLCPEDRSKPLLVLPHGGDGAGVLMPMSSPTEPLAQWRRRLEVMGIPVAVEK